MKYFILLYFTAFVIYLYSGFYSFSLNRKSFLNRIFFILCLVISVWALSFFLMNYTSNPKLIMILYKISAIGWCFMHALIINYILLISYREKFLKKWWIYPLIYLPPLFFYFLAVNNMIVINEVMQRNFTSMVIEPGRNVFILFYVLYHFTYFILFAILVINWRIKSRKSIDKKLSLILFFSCFISFMSGTLTDILFPLIRIDFPSVSPLSVMFFVSGIWYSIKKYNFMKIISTPVAFEEVISRMMDLLIVINQEGLIVKANNKLQELLEFKEKELFGVNIREIIDDPDFINRTLTLYDTENIYHSGEVNFLTKNGVKIPVSFSTSIINDREGNVADIVIIGQDIRLTRQLQLEINDRIQSQIKEEKYISGMKLLSTAVVDFVDNSADMDLYNMICERIHNLVDRNLVVVLSFDSDKDTLIPRSAFSDGVELDGNMNLYGKNPFTIKYKLKEEYKDQFKKGKLFKFNSGIDYASGNNIPDELFTRFKSDFKIKNIYLMGLIRNEELLGVVAIITKDDYHITNIEIIETLINLSSTVLQRKLIEKELKESEERYRRLVSQIPDVIWIIRDEKILFINESVKNFLGYAPSDMMGTSVYSYICEQYKPVMFKSIKHLLSGEIIQDYEIELMTGYSEKKVGIIRSSVIIYNNEPVILSVISDITERKKYELELSKAKDIAVNASKAKSEFLATMSHEVRTPINGILGMINLAFLTDLNKDQKNYLGMARSSAEYLIQIVDEVLDFSRIEAGKLELENIPFNVKTLVRTTIEELTFKAVEKMIQLKYHIDHDIPADLTGDPGRLKQIMVNLVWNAIKFTDKGEVFLGVEKIGENAEKTELKFIVRDTGIGISDEKKEKLFKSFSQGDSSSTRKYGGAGLGLAISKKLTEMMNGKIWFESKENRGSTFFFTAFFSIDKKNGKPAITAERHFNFKEEEKKIINILLAEDNTVNQEFLRIVLGKKGWNVKCVTNGKDAVEESIGNSFDIILMDIEMPVMDGLEASRSLRNKDVKTPIIALTAYAMKGDKEKCLEAGMNDYIAKPIKLEDLFKKINNLLDIQ